MRRKVSLVLALIMLLTMVPAIQTAQAADSKYQIVRVKLSIGSHTTYSFYLDGNYSIDGKNSILLERGLYNIKKDGSSLSLYSGNTKIYKGSSIKFIRHAPTKDSYNNFIWMKRSNGNYYKYLGDMRFLLNDDHIMAVNYVYMEDYLYGVVPYEMSNGWPVEALKAQAVAARSYAENYIDGEGYYDVVDTASSQVYYGYNPSYKRTISAVDSTAKQVITYGSDIVTTYFGSSNGGYTEIAQHAWSVTTRKPYQIIQVDKFDADNNSCKSESLVFPKVWDAQDDITYIDGNESYNNNSHEGYNGKESDHDEYQHAYSYIKSLAMAELDRQGYPTFNKIVGVNKIEPYNYDLSSSQHHNVTDYKGDNICPDMLSARMYLTVSGTRKATSADLNAEGEAEPTQTPGETAPPTETPTETPAEIAKPAEAMAEITEPEPTQTPEENAEPEKTAEPEPTQTPEKTAEPEPTQTPDGTAEPEPTQTPSSTEEPGISASGYVTKNVDIVIKLSLSTFSNDDSKYYAFDRHTKNRIYAVEETENDWRINHRRFGHGVGMSQYGAKARAESEDANVNTYDKIMAFYFPNTVLTTQTYERPVLTEFAVPDHSNASIVNDDTAYVRTGRGTSYDPIGILPQNARIHIEDPDTDTAWYKVIYGGNYGYVAKSKVVLDDPFPSNVKYTVNYNIDGATPEPEASSGYYGDCISKAPSVSKTGYTLEGWYLDPEFNTEAYFPYLITGDATLYAHWVPTEYKITYKLDNGTTDNPASYTMFSSDIKLVDPVKPNHIFDGWSGTGISGMKKDVTIPTGTSGSRTYTAHWTDTQPQTSYLTSIMSTKGTMSRTFSKTYYDYYKITLDKDTSATTINFTRENDDAAVYVNGTKYSYVQSSINVSMKNGAKKTYSIQVKFGTKPHTYKVVVYRNKSTNNYLKDLYPVVNGSKTKFNAKGDSGTAVTFNKDVADYYINLKESTSSVKIVDTLESSYASSSYSSKTYVLKNGETKKSTITVTAQSGAKRSYTITMYRAKSTSSALKSITTSSSKCKLSPSFSKTTLSYSLKMPSTYSSFKLYFTAAGYGAKIYINGVSGTYTTVRLSHGGSKTIKAEVVPQDKTAPSTIYTIKVTRP